MFLVSEEKKDSDGGYSVAGIRPRVACPKNMLNGPCGGVSVGKCEVNPNMKCVWILIYERLREQGLTEKYLEVVVPSAR